METIKYKFKKSFVYFWVVLVGWASFKSALTSHESRGKIMDTFVRILISLIVAVISILFLGQADLLKNVDGNASTVGLVLLAYFVLRFLANLIYLPSKLYFDQRKQVDRWNWSDVIIKKKGLYIERDLRGYGIEIINNKPFDLRAVIVQVPYFEIDGIPNEENAQLMGNLKGRRLSWKWNDHRMSQTIQSLDKMGGRATLDLFDIISNSDRPKYVITYFDVSQREDQPVEHQVPFSNLIRGELSIFASYDPAEIRQDMIRQELIYQFAISVTEKKPTMKFFRGRLDHRSRMETNEQKKTDPKADSAKA